MKPRTRKWPRLLLTSLPYLVHSPEDRSAMLETLGVRSMTDLLVDIPQSLGLESLQLRTGLSDLETMAQVSVLAARNHVYPDRLTFRGGGVYRRFIPAAVSAVTSKPEFYTAYTPYQAEASQGTLQAIFEFQTLIAELTALDVSNASLYDGATAVAEAAILAPPGEYGADIAVGEGQQLGLSPSFGGPHVGFIACTRELVRKLPGRLVGTAHDAQGRRGFVLALAAREQHIRREKATSNICTNHSLCALAAAVYLTYMGPYGLRHIADVSFRRAHSLADRLARLPGWEPAFPDHQFLNEFPFRVPRARSVVRKLARKGILGGLEVNRWFRELKDVLTFTCTEVNDPQALDELMAVLES